MPQGVWGSTSVAWLASRAASCFCSRLLGGPRLMRCVVLALIGAMLFSGPTFAATVNATQGQVLVNEGQGYRLVPGTVEAGPGATVVVNPGGNGIIVYPDGCKVPVEPGSVYTIAPDSPCQTGAIPTNPDQSASNANYYILGGVGLAGAGAGAYFLFRKTSP